MRIEIYNYEDNWQAIKDAAMFTTGKDSGKYPNTTWKKKILMAEHSPIRLGKMIIRCYDIPSFVIGHIVRHVTIIPFVSSLRSDRSVWEDGKVPDRNTLNNFQFEANFQALINVSRRRLCSSASKETREFWNLVREEIAKYEPELASCMVRECEYRGGCTEMRGCGFDKTEQFQKELSSYHMGELT